MVNVGKGAILVYVSSSWDMVMLRGPILTVS